MTADGTVIVFFTDRSRFEYHLETRLWRQINPEIELEGGANSQYPVATTSGQKIGTSGLKLADEDDPSQKQPGFSVQQTLTSLIGRLDDTAKTQIQRLNGSQPD